MADLQVAPPGEPTMSKILELRPTLHFQPDLDAHAEMEDDAIDALIAGRRHFLAERILLDRLEREADDPARLASHLTRLIQVYLVDRSLELAEPVLERLREVPGASEAATEMERAIDREKRLLSRARVTHFPNMLTSFDDFEQLVDRYLLEGYGEEPLFDRRDKIMAFGSCFAQNIARRLVEAGFDAFQTPVNDMLNTTFHLRDVVEWATGGTRSGLVDRIEAEMGLETADDMRRYFMESDVFVFTVGLSVGNVATRQPDGSVASTYRPFTVEENVQNLLRIVERIQTVRPNANVFLTVSPVPLHNAMQPYSAIEMDCISKSTGRVSVHEVVSRGIPGVRYWPSYEIVRWLNPMLPVPLFGLDDGNARHVSREMVEFITDRFIARYSKPAAAVSSQRPPIGLDLV